MRASTVLTALMLLVSAPARADPLKAAVFDLELLDTSLQGEVSGPRADEHDRLRRSLQQLTHTRDVMCQRHGGAGGAVRPMSGQVGRDDGMAG